MTQLHHVCAIHLLLLAAHLSQGYVTSRCQKHTRTTEKLENITISLVNFTEVRENHWSTNQNGGLNELQRTVQQVKDRYESGYFHRVPDKVRNATAILSNCTIQFSKKVEKYTEWLQQLPQLTDVYDRPFRREAGYSTAWNSVQTSLREELQSVFLDLARDLDQLQYKAKQIIEPLQEELQQLQAEYENYETRKEKACRLGWTSYQNSCYFVNRQKMNWSEAASFCADESSYLVEIDSNEEHLFIYSLLVNNSNAIAFIGLNNLTQKGFVWRDGRLPSFTRWDEGEPNNAANSEHCVQMFGITNAEQCRVLGDWFVDYCQSRLHSIGFWNDIPCEYLRDSVCEES